MKQKVGMIGLGIMGSAMAGNLLQAGFEVIGYDIDPQRIKDLEKKNGVAAGSCMDVAKKTDIIISSLPSDKALLDIVSGDRGLLAAGRKGLILIETSTLNLKTKNTAYDALTPAGVVMLDCPLSGTGAQAAVKDLAIYTSGNKEACDQCEEIFQGFTRSVLYAGEFGMGSKLKFVNNLLVTIHNVSAAEAFVLGMKAGLDPQMIYEAVKTGSGSSRMFEVRGPLMIAGDYDEPTMKLDVYQKDIKLIAEFAKDLNCPTPLLSASAQIYTSAMAHGLDKKDTGVVCEVMEEMAVLKRTGKK